VRHNSSEVSSHLCHYHFVPPNLHTSTSNSISLLLSSIKEQTRELRKLNCCFFHEGVRLGARPETVPTGCSAWWLQHRETTLQRTLEHSSSELVTTRLVNKFPAFYGTRKFTAVFGRPGEYSPQCHTTITIRFNIILAPTSQGVSSSGIPPQRAGYSSKPLDGVELVASMFGRIHLRKTKLLVSTKKQGETGRWYCGTVGARLHRTRNSLTCPT
jgi:hypothetical protein